MLVCPKGQMGALEARPPGCAKGQRRALSTWPRLSAGPQDASHGRRRRPLYAGLGCKLGHTMTQGPAALGLARHGGQPPVSASPQRFSTQGYVERAAVVGEDLTPFRTTSWPGLQATACPSGRKGLTVLVTCPSCKAMQLPGAPADT